MGSSPASSPSPRGAPRCCPGTPCSSGASAGSCTSVDLDSSSGSRYGCLDSFVPWFLGTSYPVLPCPLAALLTCYLATLLCLQYLTTTTLPPHLPPYCVTTSLPYYRSTTHSMPSLCTAAAASGDASPPPSSRCQHMPGAPAAVRSANLSSNVHTL